ncbi:MAG: hypothetical protein ABJB86_18605, partial [Bacteroidota bacterium]
MKRLLPFCFYCMLLGCSKNNSTTTPPVVPADSSTVKVVNGYGSGKYKMGDTVHIFSIAYSTTQLFDSWSSADLSLLNAPTEWHTWFIAPAKDVTV